jgi:hypothetical protein
MKEIDSYLQRCADGEGHFDAAFAEVKKILGKEMAYHLWLKYSTDLFIRYFVIKEE